MTALLTPPTVSPAKAEARITLPRATFLAVTIAGSLMLAMVAAVSAFLFLHYQHGDHAFTRYWINGEVRMLQENLDEGRGIDYFVGKETFIGDDSALDTVVTREGRYFTTSATSHRDGYTYSYNSRTGLYTAACPTSNLLCNL